MKATGIVRRIDDLGRTVKPKLNNNEINIFNNETNIFNNETNIFNVIISLT